MITARLLTPHGQTLAHLAADPGLPAGEIAERLAITERAARRIVAELVEDGFIEPVVDGRRTVYAVRREVADAVASLSAVSDSANSGYGDPADAPPSRRKELQAQLIVAADRLMAAGSDFAELKVEQVIAEAGISRSTFYAYFQDKDALLLALASEVLDEMWQAAGAWMELPPDAPRSEIGVVMRGTVEAYRVHRRVMAAAAAAAPGTATHERYAQLMRQTVERWTDHIAQGQRGGFVHPELDAANAAALLTWGAAAGLAEYVEESSVDDTDALATALADIVWNFLYAGVRA